MIKFIKVTDAITGNRMLINTDIIATVEKTIKSTNESCTAVSRVTFKDNRADEFAEESVDYFAKFLLDS